MVNGEWRKVRAMQITEKLGNNAKCIDAALLNRLMKLECDRLIHQQLGD